MTIGEHVRNEQKDDALFERVARGEATPEELAELERAAASDPELALRLEASRPLDDDAVDRIADGALAARSLEASPNVALSETSEPSGAERPRAAREAARAQIAGAPIEVAPVIDLPRRKTNNATGATWKRRFITAAGPLALAAAMIIYVVVQRGPGGPELPAYTVTATGEQAMRGPSEPSARLHLAGSAKRDARFELVLRPATAPEGKVVAYAFTFGEAGSEPAPLEAKVEIAPEGSVRMSGPARALEGVREIRIVIGAPLAIGKFDDAAARAKSNTSSAEIRVLVVPIDRS